MEEVKKGKFKQEYESWKLKQAFKQCRYVPMTSEEIAEFLEEADKVLEDARAKELEENNDDVT